MNKRKIAFGIGIVLAVLAVLAIFTASAAAENVAYLVPQNSSAAHGETTYVEVWLNSTAGVYSFQMEMAFDLDVVDITSATAGDFYTGFGFTSLGDGRVHIIGCNDAYDDKPAGLYKLANLTLESNNSGKCPLEFTQWTKLVQWNPAPPHNVPVTAIDGTFRCIETSSESLPEGWNLISLPLTDTTDMTVANMIDTSLSGSYDALYKYDASTHNFVSLSSSDTMENGVGYFINMTASDTWTYTGSAAYTDMSNSLEHGLNMIGGLNCPKSINDALSSIEGNYNYITRWNAHSHEFEVYVPGAPFNEFNTMERGEGYFISAKDGCPPLTENCSA